MIWFWQMVICIFSGAKQHQLSEESRILPPPACGPGIAKWSLKKKSGFVIRVADNHIRFISVTQNTDFAFLGYDRQLQLSCSKGDISFQQQLHPKTFFGYMHQAHCLPSPSSFAGASRQCICAGDPLLFRRSRSCSPTDGLTAWCSVSMQIPWFGSLPLSGTQLGQAFFFFEISFLTHFSRFLLIHLYSCLIFMYRAFVTMCNAQQAPPPRYKSLLSLLFTSSPTLFASHYDPSPQNRNVTSKACYELEYFTKKSAKPSLAKLIIIVLSPAWGS